MKSSAAKGTFGPAKNAQQHIFLPGKNSEDHVVIVVVKIFVSVDHPENCRFNTISRNRSEETNKILIGLKKVMFKWSETKKLMHI